MTVLIGPTPRPAGTSVSSAMHAAARLWRWMLAGGMLLWMAGCAVYWVSPFEPLSVERSTQISRQVFAFYQELLSTPQAERAALAAGPLRESASRIETDIRVHLLLEQARPKNAESILIIENLLASWSRFAADHLGSDPLALTDATLKAERGILERHLRSALVAEEAKKLGGGAGRGG